jgi:hypothetical protein
MIYHIPNFGAMTMYTPHTLQFMKSTLIRILTAYVFIQLCAWNEIAHAQSTNTAPPKPNAPQFQPNVTPQSNAPIQQKNSLPNIQQRSNSFGTPQFQNSQRMKSKLSQKNTQDYLKKVQALPVIAMKAYQKPQIHIALVLDISGSMNGLINQAREELWKIINTFNDVSYQGKPPEIRVALYTHGMQQASTGLYLEQRLNLTQDLDRVSEVLFSLKTSGSKEFCPTSIYAAAQGLAWSESTRDLKAILIAGNEDFVQGPLSMEKGFQPTKERSIITHSIHCGSADKGIGHAWKKASELGGGQFMNIDQNAKVEYIETPYDQKLQDLNDELNTTYIPYGADGARGMANQVAQDRNAKKMSKASSIQRAITKSGAYYTNDQWDLLDAVRTKKVQLDQIKTNALPKNMQTMTIVERKTYVQGRLEHRSSIQKKISTMKKQREVFLQEERARRAEVKKEVQGTTQRIDSAIVEALKIQAKKLGFTWLK